jgi:DNA-binding HxlR family transcriptional regulator
MHQPAWNVFSPTCPTRKVLNRVADKWTVMIVVSLAGGTQRFGALLRQIDGISQKVLTQKLREMERDGLVNRRVYASVPPKVEYTLTPLGASLIDMLDLVRRWSETRIVEILEAQASYDARADEP